jgi:hypothetical protein
MTGDVFNRVTQITPIKSVSFTLRDLESFARLIQDKNAAAVQIEHIKIRGLNVPAEDEQKYLKLVDDFQKMTIFINGSQGENIISYDPSIFQSHTLPTSITNVTIETQTFRQVSTKAEPDNMVRLNFDFSRFQFGSAKFTAANTLQNGSLLQVQGLNEAWVTSTYKSILDRIKAASNARSFLHSTGTYELGLWLVAFPMVLVVANRIYGDYQSYFDSLGVILRFGSLIYFILFSAVCYRLLFNYALWAFPSVELVAERDRSAKHRKFWFSLFTSLLFGFIGYYLYKR